MYRTMKNENIANGGEKGANLAEIPRKFTIIYGSQTGTAESLAESIADRAIKEGYDPDLYCADQHEKKFFLNRESCAVIVMSSTGDGDPPDNALKFVRQISKKGLPSDWLINLRFALLALGDSNYSTYHGNPKKLQKSLLELGARPFYETGWADDATGLEPVVEPWMDELFPALKKHFAINAPPHPFSVNEDVNGTSNDATCSNADELHSNPVPALEVLSLKVPKQEQKSNLTCSAGDLADETQLKVSLVPETWLVAKFNGNIADDSSLLWQNNFPLVGAMHSTPVTVPVVDVKTITKEYKNIKRKMEITVDLEGTEFQHEPGDSYYFVFPNPSEDVMILLRRLKLDILCDQVCTLTVLENVRKARAVVPQYIPQNASLKYILTYCCDIRRTPGRPFLRTLAEYCSEEVDRRRLLELCSVQGMHDFTQFVRKAALSLNDILAAFPSCLPPVERIIEHCPRLQPRPYSVVDSLLHTKHVRFAFTVVEQPRQEGWMGDRMGICTGWLAGRRKWEAIPILLKEPSSFRLPEDPLSTHLILVGPGTGVAPFMGFMQHIRCLQEKHAHVESEKIHRWLFFGCRNIEMDYIYKDEMREYQRDGVLTNLVLCESQPPDQRKGNKPVYVQDGIAKHAEQLYEVLCKEKSRIYVCGDASAMSKAVASAFQEVMVRVGGISEKESVLRIKQMREEKKYVEDVWS